MNSKSFAHGFRTSANADWQCAPKWEGMDLGEAGRQLIDSWTHGGTNHGLSVGSSTSDFRAYKKFYSRQTPNGAPYLAVTYTAYGASYEVAGASNPPYPGPNQPMAVPIRVKNVGSKTWSTSGGYRLGYRVFQSGGTSTTPFREGFTDLPGSVAPGATTVVDVQLPGLEPGSYEVEMEMHQTSLGYFSKEGVSWLEIGLEVPTSPPTISAHHPPSGYVSPTLTPQLSIAGHDPDNSATGYEFKICEGVQEPGSNCVTSGSVTKPYWTVPAGQLRWNTGYFWIGKITDGAASATIGPVGLSTAVPQPVITQHLAAGAGGADGEAIDPQVGNYTTGAVDASVSVVGPELALRRTFNSLDPRTSAPFGSGWSSPFDMRVSPDGDGSGSVVVRLAGGRDVRFGKNPDGRFAPPVGSFGSLAEVTGGGWRLRVQGGTLYEFDGQGRLSAVLDAEGHRQRLTYSSGGQLQQVQDVPSGRSLHLSWTGSHVTQVSTDPPAAGQAGLSWAYTYAGDKLTRVCEPTGGCTGYDYTAGSRYRAAVLDSGPQSYLRLGEASGTEAASEVDVNLGADKGTYKNVTLGAAGGLAGTTNKAVSFNGTSSSVTFPEASLWANTHLSVELWFKTTGSGVLFGYQNNTLGNVPTGWVPVLSVGTDGKLRGQFWDTVKAPITSTGAVNNGAWHHVVLTGSGSSQALYLDGALVGTKSGQIFHSRNIYNHVGAGYAKNWPGFAASTTTSYFTGAIDEVAVYPRPLGPAAIAAHYALGRTAVDQVAKVTLPSGRTYQEIAYDGGTGRVDAYTDPNGGLWRVGVPHAHGTSAAVTRSVTVFDPKGQLLTYRYDALHGGRIIEFQRGGLRFPSGTNASLGAQTFSYDTGGFLAKVTDENGHAVSYTNDARGNRLSETRCRVDTTCYSAYYNYFLNPDDLFDPRNDRLTDSRDGRSSGPADDTYRTRYGYTASGKLAVQTTPAIPEFAGIVTARPDGLATRYQYAAGTETAYGGGSTPAGLLTSVISPKGNITGYAYYSNGDLAEVTDPNGRKTRFSYDAVGRELTQTEITDSFPAGLTTTTAYNALSRPISVTEPGVRNAVTGVTHTRKTSYDYDADTNVTKLSQSDTTGGDAARVTSYTYDDHGRVAATINPEDAQTAYSYDQLGNITAVIDAMGNQFDYAYNGRNKVTEITLRDWIGDPTAPSAPADLVLHSYAYDPAGRLASHSDTVGRTDSYTYWDDDLVKSTARGSYVTASYLYDAIGTPAQVDTRNLTLRTAAAADPAGRVFWTVVDPGGLELWTVSDRDQDDNITKSVSVSWSGAGGQTVDYTHNPMGELTSQAVHNGADRLVTTWVRDQRGLPIAETDPRGNLDAADPAAYTTNYSYDEGGQLAATTLPPVKIENWGQWESIDRPITRHGYNAFGDLTRDQDARGGTTSYAYDRAGRLVSQIQPAYTPPAGGAAITPTTSYGHDPLGRLTAQTDPAGRTTTFQYDALSNLVRQTDPQLTGQDEPGTWRYSYDTVGEQLSATDPTGARTQTTYDNLGRAATQTQIVRDGESSHAYTSQLTYDTAGNLSKVTSAAGVEVNLSYNALGRPTAITDALNNTTTFAYDYAGQITKATQPSGTSAVLTYDGVGRLTEAAQHDSNGTRVRASSLAYDAAGNPVRATSALGHTTSYTYDATDLLVKQVEPVADGKSITSIFGYDHSGNRTRFTDGRGNSTWSTYNPWDLRESIIENPTQVPPQPERTWTTSYDANGLPVHEAVPGGVQRQRTYNELGDLIRETGSGAEVATTPREFGYDLAGRLTSANGGAGVNTFGYDDRGLLLSAEGPSGNATFGYDPDGRMIRRTDAAGAATFTYDAAGRLATSADPITGRTFSYSYNSNGLPSSTTYGDSGPSRASSYDNVDRLTGDVIKSAGGQSLASINYNHDADDRLTGKTTTGYAAAGSTTYAYDQSDRLTSTQDGTATADHGWDDAGNQTKNQTSTRTFDDRNRLISDGAASYTYTPRGTLATRTESGQTKTWKFDAFDRLIESGTTSYEYDALDRVISRNGQPFGYSGTSNNLTTDGTAKYGRAPGGELLSINKGPSNLAAITDRHGDLVGTIDPTTGTSLADSAAYDPFGNITARSGTSHSLGYQGGWTDPDSGDFNMHARWYNPGTGSFRSRDDWTNSPTPRSIGANRYTYGNGNPLSHTDPSGHRSDMPDAPCNGGGDPRAALTTTSVGAKGLPDGGCYEPCLCKDLPAKPKPKPKPKPGKPKPGKPKPKPSPPKPKPKPSPPKPKPAPPSPPAKPGAPPPLPNPGANPGGPGGPIIKFPWIPAPQSPLPSPTPENAPELPGMGDPSCGSGEGGGFGRELLMVNGPAPADDCDPNAGGIGPQPLPDYDEAIALPFEIILIVVAVALILLAYLLTELIRAVVEFIGWYLEQVRMLYGIIFGVLGGIIASASGSGKAGKAQAKGGSRKINGYSGHAKKRMAERGISEDMVDDAVRTGKISSGSQQGTKKFKGRRVTVIKNNNDVVVTVEWT